MKRIRNIPKSIFIALTPFVGLTGMATPALADLQIRFSESAPKDRFTISKSSKCDLGPASVMIDLSGSNAGLIFDVTALGGGVEVFQPFEVVEGGKFLIAKPTVLDGDNTVELKLSDLPVGKSVAFTIDVDDTIGVRAITVAGSEIQGAKVRLVGKGITGEGTFSRQAVATIKMPSCNS